MMKVTIKGNPRYISKQEVRDCVRWMAKQFKMDKYKDPLWIHMVYTPQLQKKTGFLGFCIWEDRNHRPREFTIEVDANRSKSVQVQAIIHEMVHVWQFATGKTKDLLRHFSVKKWCGRAIDTNGVDYWDLPWEQQAYAYERKYWIDYMDYKKKCNNATRKKRK